MLAIDTYEIVKELKAAGFSEDQVEAATRVVCRAQTIDRSASALKRDLEWHQEEGRVEVELMRRETRAQSGARRRGLAACFAEAKSDLLPWVVGATGVQAGAILSAVPAPSHVRKP